MNIRLHVRVHEFVFFLFALLVRGCGISAGCWETSPWLATAHCSGGLSP